MQEGITPAQVTDLEHYAHSPHFSARERLALTYAERITQSDQDVDDGLFVGLQQEFASPAAIVELTAMVAFENFRSKFNHALLIESNGFCLLNTPHGQGTAP
jgi:alkylhydroperoxidase family enzyme